MIMVNNEASTQINTLLPEKIRHRLASESDFVELYELYYKKIYGFLFRSILNPDLAEDLTSDTFLKALDFFRKTGKVIENFSAWIYKIAANELLLYYRKHKKMKVVSIEQSQDDLSTALAMKNPFSMEMYTDFLYARELIQKLPARDRILVEFHFFEKLTHKEIAEITGKNENTIRSRLSRALKKLRIAETARGGA